MVKLSKTDPRYNALMALSAEVRSNLPSNLETHKKLTATQRMAMEMLKSKMKELSGNSEDAGVSDPVKVPADNGRSAGAPAAVKVENGGGSAGDAGPHTAFSSLLFKYNGDLRKALFEWCFSNNIIYDDAVITDLIEKTSTAMTPKIADTYLGIINSDEFKKDKTFFSQIKLDNFVELSSDNLIESGLTEAGKAERSKIMQIIGYDPFRKNPEEDRPALYHDLAGMLTETMHNDIPKQKAAIMLVQNYANLDKYNKRLRGLTQQEADGHDVDPKEVKDVSSVITQLQSSINQTAKENSFTGAKTIGEGRGTISSIMDKIDSDSIDLGKTNAFDIKTAAAMQQVADLSFAAMAKQLNLQDSDYAAMVAEQAKTIKDQTKMLEESREELRLARAEITKQSLLDEFGEMCKRKGLSDQDIDDYINEKLILHGGEDEIDTGKGL